MRVRISAAAFRNLDGGSLFQTPDDLDQHGYGQAGQRLVQKVLVARPRSDGSVIVDLDRDEVQVLRELADCAADAAADDAGYDRSVLGDLNACRALVRQIDRVL